MGSGGTQIIYLQRIASKISKFDFKALQRVMITGFSGVRPEGRKWQLIKLKISKILSLNKHQIGPQVECVQSRSVLWLGPYSRAVKKQTHL